MKQFTTIKTGYTSGVYGCTGEYFTTIYSNDGGLGSFHFYGLYGAEERIARAMKEKGYEEKYTSSFYGHMTRKDVTRLSRSEYLTLDEIKKSSEI